MKIFTPLILFLLHFTFATQQNDGPCEYGCWGGEIDVDCERGCIQWCEEQDRALWTCIIGHNLCHIKAGPDQSIDPWKRVVVIQITMVPIHVIPNVLALWDVAFKISILNTFFAIV